MHETREAWLIEATKHLRPWFEQEDAPLPNIQVSIGVQPGATTLATCYPDDKEPGDPEYTSNIYVTPAVDPEEPTRLLDILLHEMVHAANHFQGINGHGKEFGAIARALGLTGKMVATVASPELVERLQPIAEVLGPFPHNPMNLAARGLGPGGKPKQTTRMIKTWCGDCGYTSRTSRKWLEVAIPLCPNVDCGAYQHEMLVEGA
jgi:hypothetical protein